jgi:hypothetical protein
VGPRLTSTNGVLSARVCASSVWESSALPVSSVELTPAPFIRVLSSETRAELARDTPAPGTSDNEGAPRFALIVPTAGGRPDGGFALPVGPGRPTIPVAPDNASKIATTNACTATALPPPPAQLWRCRTIRN